MQHASDKWSEMMQVRSDVAADLLRTSTHGAGKTKRSKAGNTKTKVYHDSSGKMRFGYIDSVVDEALRNLVPETVLDVSVLLKDNVPTFKLLPHFLHLIRIIVMRTGTNTLSIHARSTAYT